LPGLGTIAPPLAGALGMSFPTHLVYDAAGNALKAAGALGVGFVFHDRVAWLNEQMGMLGTATFLLGFLVAGYLAYRPIQRWLFIRSLRLARVSVRELSEMIARGQGPVVLDVRSSEHRRLDDRQIPGARAVDMGDLAGTLGPIPRDREVVVYCACPDEASAVTVALMLRARGFRRVRPLEGGIDAWSSAGFLCDTVSVSPTGEAGNLPGVDEVTLVSIA
jgi:rhodanese-related sulfurtransferase